MTTEAIQRSIFKMDPAYWQQRLPPSTNGMVQSPDQPPLNPSPNHEVKFSQMKKFAENYSYSPKYDKFEETEQPPVNPSPNHEVKFSQAKEFGENYAYSPKYDKFEETEQDLKQRSSPTEAAQNLSTDGYGYKSQPRTPEISPHNSILQNLSPEQLRNIQSTLANITQQNNDVRNVQANAVQNLSTHIQNVITPNALSPTEVRNLQTLAISNLCSQVQTITNASLNIGDIRNLTTIAVQNLTNHIENLRHQNANLTPNEVRNLTSVAVQNLTNHIQNLNQISQPPPANDLQRNLAAFQQLANPNFSAMQNLSNFGGMTNNIAAVSAVLSAAAAQQAALNATGPAPAAPATDPPAEAAEPEASNGSNAGSASGAGTNSSLVPVAGAAAATALVPLGSGSNSNAEKLNSGDSSIFMHKSAMQMHARDLQSKPHQCQQCMKSFSSNHQLVQHIRVHTGEKPYKCSYCDRRFKQLSHVQQHTRLHTGERPYRCHLPECGRAFIQLSNLQQHLRNHDAQVERAKNRPFHCSICGKGFATESSLRTHTSKEQREALLQGIPLSSLEPSRIHEMAQLGNPHNTAAPNSHASLLTANQNAVTCPLCHKLFLGGENLMEHMKLAHKDPPPAPAPAPTSYLAKRRTANHPCPICGKHYVNEGSLRKHLACHPETAQFSSSLRMWPCSVCQAVFTHESGLLSHMEHMRMDPKHQFAAQYVLSRAAAERRERENIIAAAAAVNAGGFGLGGQSGNSICPSPAPSDSSSLEHLSSTGSDTGGHIPNNNNNTKMDLSHMSPTMQSVRASTPTPMEYSDIPNRMAALNAIVQAQNMHQEPEEPQPDKFMEQIVPSNLTMRSSPPTENNNEPPAKKEHLSIKQEMPIPPRTDLSPAQAQQLAAMRANLESMRNIESLAGIRSGFMDNPIGNHHQQPNESVYRMQQQAAEVLLRTQAEAALRLAVSQAQAQAQAQAAAAANAAGDRAPNNLHSQLSPDLSEALRLQEQRLEQALRLHGDPRVLGFSLNAAAAASAASAHANSNSNTANSAAHSPVNNPNPTPNNT